MDIRKLLMRNAALGALLLMLAPTVASAAEPTFTEIEELIVTAQRRAENVQDVPISMTVLTGEDVAQHIRTSNDLAQLVPNVNFSPFVGFAIPRTGIRGITQSDFNGNATTSNMIYIDDVPMNSPLAQGIPLWDLDRVEVLRGPQGTLFGRNATGGAVRYISALPTDEAKGAIDFTVGAWDQRGLNAFYSAPITDTLKFRVAYVSHDFGGEIENPIRNERQGKQKYAGVRGVLQWTPTETIDVVLRAQYFSGDQDVFAWKSTPGLASLASGFCGPTTCQNGYRSVADIQRAYGFKNLGPGSNYSVYETEGDTKEHIEHTPISLTADIDLGFATLTSVTGFLDVNQSFILDADSGPAPILMEYYRHQDQQYSQEFRLTSKGDGAFKWIAGAFYMEDKVKVDIAYDATAWRSNVPGNGVTNFPNSPTVGYRRGSVSGVKTYAAFLHTTYDITPDLILTVAGRWTKEEKEIAYRFRSTFSFATNVPRSAEEFVDFKRAVDTNNLGAILSPADPSVSTTRSFAEPTWKVGLDYKLNDKTLLYALVSRGFKGGAFNATANTRASVLNPDGSVITVKPEIVTDYEAGFKSDIIPGRLRVNASAFYYDYSNYQTNQLITALAVQILSNLKKSELYGIDFDVTAVPIENLTIIGGVGLLHTEIKKAADPRLEGNKLPLAEDFNWNFVAKYDIATQMGTFTPEVSAKHYGTYYSYKENVSKLGNYTLWNARVGFEDKDARYFGSLWVTNLADKVVPTNIDDATELWGSDIAYTNQHRRYGLTLGARF